MKTDYDPYNETRTAYWPCEIGIVWGHSGVHHIEKPVDVYLKSDKFLN
jgi:hypothetical protein